MRQSKKNLSSIFRKSRAIYLRKHVGLVRGSLVDLWLWCTDEWRAFLLFFCAVFVRLQNFSSLQMIDDVRRDYGQAVLMVQGKALPLLGIPSSVPRFSQGPLNIWFDAIAFKLGGVSLYSPVVLAGICTSLSVVFLYFLLKERVGKNTSMLASLLFVFSPAAISQSRLPFYLFAIPFFVLLFLEAIQHLRVKTGWSVFWAFFSFCLLFQWELATIPFIAVLLFALYQNKIRILSFWKYILFSVGLGLSPQLLFDATHHCQQLCQFVVWMGYRTVAVSGIDGRHSLTVFSGEFWTRMIAQLERVVGFGIIGLIATAAIITTGVLISFTKRQRSSLYLYTLLSSVCLFGGLIIHGEPSESYFPPFIALIPILLGFSLHLIWEKLYAKK